MNIFGKDGITNLPTVSKISHETEILNQLRGRGERWGKGVGAGSTEPCKPPLIQTLSVFEAEMMVSAD